MLLSCTSGAPTSVKGPNGPFAVAAPTDNWPSLWRACTSHHPSIHPSVQGHSRLPHRKVRDDAITNNVQLWRPEITDRPLGTTRGATWKDITSLFPGHKVRTPANHSKERAETDDQKLQAWR
jgi:hypothetical protein